MRYAYSHQISIRRPFTNYRIPVDPIVNFTSHNFLTMKFTYLTFTTVLSVLFLNCSAPKTDNSIHSKSESSLSDDSLINLVQKQTFQYFWEGAEPNSGLARERIHIDGEYPQNDENVITIGGSGFG